MSEITEAAEKQYLADHQRSVSGRGYAVYNPNNKPLDELPFIYGFNNGGGDNFMQAALVAEDGTPLGSHLCSHEGYMESDLGILEGSRSDRHEEFKKHYPDGYRMDFIGYEAVEGNKHIGFELAMKKHQIQNEDQAKSEKAS